MTGWMLFKHAVMMVVRNWREAMRISLLLFVVLALIELSLSGVTTSADAGISAVTALSSVFLGIVYLVISLWIAVAWHRYILLEELPEGWMPRWHGPEILRYLGVSLLIGLVVLISALLGYLVIAALAAISGVLAALTGFAMFLFIGSMFYRLCPMLPAVAIGQKMTLREAWDQTQGTFGAIVLIIVLQLASAIVLNLPVVILAVILPVFGVVGQILANWAITLIGASLLTTFYGHFVEERPLV